MPLLTLLLMQGEAPVLFIDAPPQRTIKIPIDSRAVSRKWVIQQPSEVLDYDFDFTNAFPAGDDIVTALITATGTGLVIGAQQLGGQKVKQWVSVGVGAVLGTDYKVTCVALSEGGRKKEWEFYISLRDT